MTLDQVARLIRIVGIVMVIVAVPLCVTGAWKYWTTRQFVNGAKQTTGFVVANVTDATQTYYPVFEFEDEAGTIHQAQSDRGSPIPLFEPEVRPPVGVIYTPGKQTIARIYHFPWIWGSAILFSLAGSLLLPLGLAAMYPIPWFVKRFWGAPPLPASEFEG